MRPRKHKVVVNDINNIFLPGTYQFKPDVKEFLGSSGDWGYKVESYYIKNEQSAFGKTYQQRARFKFVDQQKAIMFKLTFA